jgi:hypothetical protein
MANDSLAAPRRVSALACNAFVTQSLSTVGHLTIRVHNCPHANQFLYDYGYGNDDALRGWRCLNGFA